MLQYKRSSRPLFGVAVLLTVLVASVASNSTAVAQSTDKKAPPIKVEGFRSAQFGSSEKAVRSAIAKDFKIKGDKVMRHEDPVYKTPILLIEVDDVIPDTGRCVISYVFGYKSKKLIQANLFWTMYETDITLEQLRSTALLLREYFLGRGFDPDKVTLNSKGSPIIFRGFDAKDRMIGLTFEHRRAAAKDKKDKKKDDKKPDIISSLRLSYVQNVDEPDIFLLDEKSF